MGNREQQDTFGAVLARFRDGCGAAGLIGPRPRAGKARCVGGARKRVSKAILRSRFDGTPGSGNYPGLRCDWCDRLIKDAHEGAVA